MSEFAAIEDPLVGQMNELGIGFEIHRHPPVMTVDEAKALRGDLPGVHIKNLFLRDRKKRCWLLTTLEDRTIDLKAMRPILQAKGSLSFGSADLLRECLGIEPGAVTPLAVLNDKAGRVTLVLDRALCQGGPINCHPLHNAATMALSAEGLTTFCAHFGHTPAWVDF